MPGSFGKSARKCATTLSTVSRGIIRTFTVARASLGSTFSFGLPESMVGANVVRNTAFIAVDFERAALRYHPNSHWFAIAFAGQSVSRIRARRANLKLQAAVPASIWRLHG